MKCCMSTPSQSTRLRQRQHPSLIPVDFDLPRFVASPPAPPSCAGQSFENPHSHAPLALPFFSSYNTTHVFSLKEVELECGMWRYAPGCLLCRE